ncbi:AAA family ATPase [Paludibacter jiangxiensis]|uniref:Wobble nucleotide-excising tRNase n=1 Tax=Paludibacter jiangxiensis TaxID=681398 RepID=A0A170YRT2_9BACT|nr:AAA family ATPase [Paludibacter jiangxiensis]GAT62011.1 Wobble nucleotide-excising tRNase [Paludibacter jiangxiensis]
MIESISLKNVASFDSTGIQIDNLKRVNFIYGSNGCGKTTISNFLLNPTDPKFQNCFATWKNGTELKTLVYNKEFRVRNFDKGKLEGVFTLGEATKEQKRIITEKNEQLKQFKIEGERIRISLTQQEEKLSFLETDFKEFAWTKIYKKYQSIFKDAFVGSMKSGDLFKTRLLLEFTNNKGKLKTIDELKEKASTIFVETPQNLNFISQINFDRIIEIEKDSIWKRIIVGKADVDIAKLIQRLNISDWVNQGRTYVQESNICPFCQQHTITDKFKNQLESFFDETYLMDIESLKILKQEYSSLIQTVINELNSTELTQKELKNSKLNLDKFASLLKTLISQNTTNNEYLNNKLKEPSRSVELISQKELLTQIFELISTANNEIKQHNDIVLDYSNQRNDLINAIWKYLIDEFKGEIEKFSTTKKGLEAGHNSIEAQLKNKLKDYSNLNSEIKELSKNVTSIQPTINEINRLLKSYGFNSFEIVPAEEDGFYKIQRENGEIAESTLSEGEITFITFLYFLQHAKGGSTEDNVNEERILVIDDPISSLDSNVLFVVSTLIKEILKEVKSDKGNIKQVILLTHNVYFHKEVSYEGLNRKGEKPQFWILRKNYKFSKIQHYNDQNPIQSSYELLWRDIKEWEKNSGITIQNTMRRILENFFSILGNKRDDYLIGKFQTQEEREICRSLLSWVNEGSHTFSDDLYIETPDGMIVKYLNVFKAIFKHTKNIGHYNMMMGISDEIETEQEVEIALAN